MPVRTIVTLVVAVFLGLVAVLLVRNYFSTARPPVQTAQDATGVPVVVAAVPVERGLVLQPTMLKVVMFPAASAPPGAFAGVAQLTGPKPVQRLVLHALVPNEPILRGAVTEPGGRLNLSSVLTPGMRAVALRSSDVAGVGGFVLPGDKVDVLLTRALGTGEHVNTVTQVVAGDVLVLGVDQSDNQDATKPVVAKAVTIQVTPLQAQEIALGQQVGALSLALRQVGDDMQPAKRATQVAELGFAPRAAAPLGALRGRGRRGLPRNVIEVRVTRGVETTALPVGF
jgi:pilus assembly protein CpaB